MKIIYYNHQDFADISELLPRSIIDYSRIRHEVAPIIEDIRLNGQEALKSYTEKYDGYTPESFFVPKESLSLALETTPADLLESLNRAIERVRACHQIQKPKEICLELDAGAKVTQTYVPVRRAGVYIPGGNASYPSSVIMNVVCAKVAGVEEIVAVSPGKPEFDGLPAPLILATLKLLGVSEVLSLGGVAAIGALAYGFSEDTLVKGTTQTAGSSFGKPKARKLNPVDIITGPGNIYVTCAKQLVQDTCKIDSVAGPSEIMILADRSANPHFMALDLIAQAEHDLLSACILVTDSLDFAKKVEAEVKNSLLSNCSDIAPRALLAKQSALVVCDNLDEAVQLVNSYAPEHLQIVTADPIDTKAKIRNAGAIFLGNYSPVALGDYLAGSNHVLPTSGSARYSSGLNVTTFLKSVQVVDYTKSALMNVAKDIARIATAEGLLNHAKSVTGRYSDEEDSLFTGKHDCTLDKLANEDGENDLLQSDSEISACNLTVHDPLQNKDLGLNFRPDLQSVQPYGAPQLEVTARLNVNENPYPPSLATVKTVIEEVEKSLAQLNRYADRDALELRDDLADYLKWESGVTIPSANIWAANGSNEVMQQLFTAFGGPGALALSTYPAYSMYPEYARNSFTKWQLVHPTDGNPADCILHYDLSALLDALPKLRPNLVLLASPNNPTGLMLGLEQIKQLLEVAKTSGPKENTASLVILDEAYVEFRNDKAQTALNLLEQNPHLVVTRSLSKAFGAAGLRLGYLVSHTRIIDEVMKVRLPYHLSLITQASARAVLKNRDSVFETISAIKAQRQILRNELLKLKFLVSDSNANFLLFGPVLDEHRIWQELLDQDVLIRNVGPKGYLRVTVGTEAENQKFLQALRKVLEIEDQ